MRVGAYEVVGEIGRGGVGVVYEALAPDARRVAIKVLMRRSPDAAARFERERRLLASFGEAEGFVPLLDAGEVQGQPFLVMPFVEGGTLRDRMKRGPFAPEVAVPLFATLARAVGRAHERGIVHRDLKPENVLFEGERPLLADLGIAKHFRDDVPGASRSVSLTREGGFKGTVGYMPPEQMRDAREALPAADVFALGAILYEALAGRPAFAGDNVLVVLANAEAGKFEPLERVEPRVPRWLARVVAKALAQDPEARFATGGELAAALEAGSSGDVGGRSTPARFALVGGVGLAVALGLFFLRRSSPPTIETTAAALAPSPPPTPRATPSLAPRPSPTPTPSVAERARALVESATAHVEARELDLAIRDATDALDFDPGSGSAFYLRALARRRKHQFPESLADVSRALELDPTLVRAWILRADVRRHVQDEKGAERDARRALEIDPKSGAAFEALADTERDTNQLEAAFQDYSRALELDPSLEPSWERRGDLKRGKNDVDGAIADLDRAIALDSTASNAWLLRGLAKRDKGDRDGAIYDLTRTIELAPGYALAWVKRGEIRETKGDLAGALEDFRQTLTLGSKDDPNVKRARVAIARLEKKVR